MYTFNGANYDIDFIGQAEDSSTTVPTYAAVTSRSYHSGLVNVALMDGSVRVVTNNVDRAVWQAASTRTGGEPTTLTQ